MAPMSKRKHAVLIWIAVIYSFLTIARGSIMAVDLGSEYLKVSLIKPGRTPISIVVNEMSKRKTPALVCFANGERLLGEEASSLAVRYPESTVSRARDLLAKSHDDASIATMLKEYNLPYSVVQHPVRKQAAVKLKDGTYVSGEELVASILHYAKQIAEAQSGALVLDAVIAVPAYYGQAQRQALVDAAGLVGLNVMGLINTHTAAALQFGIERDFANKTQNVVLYDMGSGGTVVSLIRYSSYVTKEAGLGKAISQLEVKDVDWDSELGADSLDMQLVKHFVRVFSEKSRIPEEEVLSNPRSMAKMKKQVRRTKEMLSANTAAPISVEELHDGRDFQSSITREEFEKLGGQFFERAAAPLKRILERSGLKVDELDYVELLGGGTRVPKLQTVLSEALGGRVLDRHVDADEAVVLGASLFAANLSTSFRLRKFGMADVSMYGITLKEDEVHYPPSLNSTDAAKPEVQDRNLLPYLKRLPAKRIVQWGNLTQDPLRLSLRYNDSAPHPLPPGVKGPQLATFTITGIDTVIKRYNQSGTVNVKFEASYDGILHLTKAEAVVEYYVMEQKLVPVKSSAGNGTVVSGDKEKPSDGGKDTENKTNKTDTLVDDTAASSEGDGTAADDAPAEEEEQQPSSVTEPDTNQTSAGKEDASDSSDSAQSAQDEDKKSQGPAADQEGVAANGSSTANTTVRSAPKFESVWVPKKKVAKVALNVSVSWAVPPLDEEGQRASLTLLAKWLEAEMSKKVTAAAKNELEAYIIRMREAVENSERLHKVTTVEQRDPFLTALSEAEDWLYMDGEGEAVTVFKDRLASLKKIGDAFETRAQEAEDRPQVVSAARRGAELKQSTVSLWATDRPWVTEEERKELESKITSFLSWLDAQEALQAKKEPHVEPAFSSRDVAIEYDKLEKSFIKLSNKKKPKPPPEPPVATNTTDNVTAGTASPESCEGGTDGKCDSSSRGEGAAGGSSGPEAAPNDAKGKTAADNKAKEAEEKAKKEAIEKAKREAAEKAKKEAADKARQEKDAKAKKAADDKAKKEQAKKDTAQKAKQKDKPKDKGTKRPDRSRGKADRDAEEL